MQRRALLSMGFAALLAILFGLILNLTPRGLQPASLATILSLLALFLAAVSYVRWSELPRRNRFSLKSKNGLRSARTLARTPQFSVKGRGLYLIFGAIVIGSIAAIAFTLNMNQISSSEQGFTEFQVSWPKGLAGTGDASLQNGSEKPENAKITNQELTNQSAITNSSKIDDLEKKQLVIMEQESKVMVPSVSQPSVSQSSSTGTSASNLDAPSSQTTNKGSQSC